MICPRCGYNLSDGVTECPYCKLQLAGGDGAPAYNSGYYNQYQIPPLSGYYGGAPARKQTNTKAIISLVLGIFSITNLGLLGGIPAAILGFMARKEIALDPMQDGDGMALGGIITGIIGSVLSIFLILFYIMLIILMGA